MTLFAESRADLPAGVCPMLTQGAFHRGKEVAHGGRSDPCQCPGFTVLPRQAGEAVDVLAALKAGTTVDAVVLAKLETGEVRLGLLGTLLDLIPNDPRCGRRALKVTVVKPGTGPRGGAVAADRGHVGAGECTRRRRRRPEAQALTPGPARLRASPSGNPPGRRRAVRLCQAGRRRRRRGAAQSASGLRRPLRGTVVSRSRPALRRRRRARNRRSSVSPTCSAGRGQPAGPGAADRQRDRADGEPRRRAPAPILRKTLSALIATAVDPHGLDGQAEAGDGAIRYVPGILAPQGSRAGLVRQGRAIASGRFQARRSPAGCRYPAERHPQLDAKRRCSPCAARFRPSSASGAGAQCTGEAPASDPPPCRSATLPARGRPRRPTP